MARDAATTRARILEAATTEFATRGIAGARVDRIAELAGCNKALLYTYFGNKEQLFDAVFAALVRRLVTDNPIDADHVDEYAGRLVDYNAEHPEIVRLALWDRLERDGAGMRSAELLATDAAKAASIATAQSNGTISTRFSPEVAMALITVLSSMLPLLAPGTTAELRAAVTAAVERLLR
jgi:AcrR family transcriptional regulator